MQKAAQDAGGSAIALDDATEREFPDADLARTVFAATPDTVTGPAKGALGWRIVRVTKVTPGSEQSFDEVKDALRDEVLAAKAVDLMYDRANKVDNVLGSGAGLDEMPSDLGLVGVAGTLDAEGNTADGTPAPIPGAAELKTALIKAAFEVQKGDPLRLVEVQTPSTGGSAYYALSVEDVTPPAVKPFDDGEGAGRGGLDARCAAARAGAGGGEAAGRGEGRPVAGRCRGGRRRDRAPYAARRPRRRGRGHAAAARAGTVRLKQGEPTMVETGDGFIVAVPAEIVEARPEGRPGRLRPGAPGGGALDRHRPCHRVRRRIARARAAAHQSAGSRQRHWSAAHERLRPARLRRLPVRL